MASLTSSLPDELLKSLAEKAESLAVPKDKIIENALQLYLNQLEKAEYIKSYKLAGEDKDVMLIAEEGMEDYLEQFQL